MWGTLFDHFSDGGGGIDFHGGEVSESIHLARILAKLLSKRIGQVVCGIRADEQDTLPDFGELYGQGTGCGGFADTSLPATEYPLQRRLERISSCLRRGRGNLVEDVLEGGGEEFVHLEDFVCLWWW